MKCAELNVKKQNEMTLVEYYLGAADAYDDRVSDKVAKLPNIIPFQYKDEDGKRSIISYVHGETTLDVVLKRTLKKPEVLAIIKGLLCAFEIGASGVQISYLVRDSKYIYIDPETFMVKCILVPVKQDPLPQSEIPDFFRNIISRMRFDEIDKDNYVAQILTIVNSDNYSNEKLKELIDSQFESIGMFYAKESGLRGNIQEGASFIQQNKDIRVSRVGVMNNTRPQMPPMPNMQAPNMTGAPMPNMQAPNMTGTPMPNMQAPNMVGVPVPPQAPNMTGAPMPPQAPNMAGAPVPPQAPNMPKPPVPPQAPNMPKPPVAPQAPNMAGAPVPNMQAPNMVGTPVAPQAPNMPKPPVPPQAPNMPKPPVPPQAPNMPKPPVAPQAPNMPKPPVPPQAPNMAGAPMPNMQAPNMAGAPMPNMQAPNMPKPPVPPQAPNMAGAPMPNMQAPNMSKPQMGNLPSGNLVGQFGTRPVPHLVRKATGETINITKPEFVIGKSKTKADYTIENNGAISRVHCTIVQKDGVNYIKDDNSTNHTYVNDVELQPGKEVLLKHKTQIKLGDEEFTFLLRNGD